MKECSECGKPLFDQNEYQSSDLCDECSIEREEFDSIDESVL